MRIITLCLGITLSVATTLPAQWTQLGSDIDGSTSSENLGTSSHLSADGLTLAVGSPGFASSGRAQVLTFQSGSWGQKGADILGQVSGDACGASVALTPDGNTLAVSSTRHDGSFPDIGRTRVFDWNGAAWVQRGAGMDGNQASGFSGDQIDISSDGLVVAIGAQSASPNGTASGQMRIFAWNGSAWVQRGADINGEAFQDFASAVSLSADGSVVAFGGYRNDSGSTNAGHVRVFVWNGSAWVLRGAELLGAESGDLYGTEVSLSADGTILAVGSPGAAGGGSRRGLARVHVWEGSGWVQRGPDINGLADDDQAGWSLDLSPDGSILALAANSAGGIFMRSGQTRVLRWDAGIPFGASSWVDIGSSIEGEADFDASGVPVSISSDGSIVAISARFNDGASSNTGHVRVFEFMNALPIELGNFSARQDGEVVRLSWETLSYQDAAEITLQYRSKIQGWKDLASYPLSAFSNELESYEYSHEDLISSSYAYRLLMKDFDGSVQYSEVIQVEIDFEVGDMEIYPNPTADYIIVAKVNQGARFELTSLDGRSMAVYPDAGGRIDLSTFTAGHYVLSKMEGFQVTRSLIIKSR